MKKIVLEISYIGTNYFGWQIQPNKISIQKIIQDAFKNALNEEINLQASGRTDTGVHAYKQIAHFETNTNIEDTKYANILNSFLPEDIHIIKSYEVDKSFHARFSAKSKTYVYKIYNQKEKNIFLNNRAYHVENILNIKKMKLAIKKIKGTHDFKCLCKAYKEEKNCIRTINFIKIKSNKKTHIIDIYVNGNGFLRNMVRILAGLLIDIGLNRIQLEDVSKLFDTDKKPYSIKTMPAYALYLKDVLY